MANIFTRTKLIDIASDDHLFIQDASDTTEGASGTSKRTTPEYLENYFKREIGEVSILTGNSVKPSYVMSDDETVNIEYTSPLGFDVFPFYCPRSL
jgi:hypothetical protein